MSGPPRIIVLGDLMVVTAGRVERMPQPGENVLLREPSVHVSGVGANVAFGLRAEGLAVTLVGAVGADPPGDRILHELRAGGVDERAVRRVDGGVTGSMLVMVEPSGERTMVGTRGVSERFELEPASVLRGSSPSAWVHVSGYMLLDEPMARRCEALVDAAEITRIPWSVDLEGIASAGRRSTLDRGVAFANLDECTGYFGTADPARLAALRDQRSGPLVVKAGPDGCTAIDRGRVVHVPAATRLSGGDSTGAGDAFEAAFIAARLRGSSLEGACVAANTAGARAVRTAGPRPTAATLAAEGPVG